MTCRARISSPSASTTRSAPSGRIGVHPAAGPGAVAELAAHRRRQPPGPAEQVARDQRALAAPHEREQADPAPRRQLVELRRRAMRRAGEDLAPRRAAAGRGTRRRCGRPRSRSGVRAGGTSPPRAGSSAPALTNAIRSRDRQRQPERIRLDAAAVEHRGADGEPHHAARDRARSPARTRAPSRRRASPAPGTDARRS